MSMMKGFASAFAPPSYKPPMFDIGLNLLDDMFKGEYNGKQRHLNDTEQLLYRAKSIGVHSILCTAGNIDESRATLDFCQEYRSKGGEDCPLMYSTVGIHPTRCSMFAEEDTKAISDLEQIITDGLGDGTVRAIGECGLDYDRLHFCDKESQKKGFILQLELSKKFQLPLFLHNRNTRGDFVNIMRENIDGVMQSGGGVVHSFTGDIEEMNELASLGLFIGVNGCSLKTEENLKVAAAIPLHLLLLETDAPWCGIKNTHAGSKLIKTTFPTVKKEKWEEGMLVKDRNEPCNMIQVLEIVANIRSMDPEELAVIVFENSKKLFGV